MEYVQKLPFVLGAVMAITVGIISFKGNADIQQIYVRMTISMVVFYILGLILRSTIVNINDEITARKEAEEDEERQRELEEQNLAANGGNQPQAEAEAGAGAPKFDYVVDDDLGEDFSPLSISEVIKTKS